jgi:hypothetical protein
MFREQGTYGDAKMVRITRVFLVAALTVASLGTTKHHANAAATTQPPGPATKLYIINRTDQTATFRVERVHASATIPVEAGYHVTTKLGTSKGDRVIFAAEYGSELFPFAHPLRIYDVTYFNASTWPGPAVGVVLQKDGDKYKLFFLKVSPEGDVSLPSDSSDEVKKLFEKNKDGIKEAMGRPQENSSVS